jgi:hypothetical protein
MAGKTDYLENRLLDHIFNAVASTAPANTYLALFTAAPTDAGGGTEVSGNAYARQAISFGNASGGQVANDAVLNFPAATPAGWGTIVAVAIFDAVTAGNMLYWALLSPNQTIGINGILSFPVGQIVVTDD